MAMISGVLPQNHWFFPRKQALNTLHVICTSFQLLFWGFRGLHWLKMYFTFYTVYWAKFIDSSIGFLDFQDKWVNAAITR